MKNKYQILKLLIISLTVFLLFGFIVYPLWQLLLAGSLQQSIIGFLCQKQVFSACLNSLLLSVVSVVGSAFIGTYFAFSFHYKTVWLKPILSILVLLPIAIPPMVGVMSFLFLLGDNGLLMKVLGLKKISFSGWQAIILVHFYSFYPLFYLFVGNALKSMDSSVIEAAHVLGARKNRIFCSIVLPHLKPALLGASLLTFMASMASFSAPFIFGGSRRFLSTEIYYAKINGDTSSSAVLSLVLAFISFFALRFFKQYNNKSRLINTKGTIKKNNLVAYKKRSYSTTIISILFGAIIMLPIISLFIISIVPDNAMMETGLKLHLSFRNYRNLIMGSDFLQPFANSFTIAFLTVFIAVLLGLSVAHITRGKQNMLKSFLELTASIPYGLPGTVIAICLIISFNQPTIFTMNAIMVGSFWILPVAYTIRNLPIITQSIKAALQSLDSSIGEASNALGATNFKTWRSITVPLIFPSIAEGALLVFINAFGEFVATILLYNYSSKTVPIEIYSQMRLYNNGMAATYGIIVFLIVIGIIALTRKMLHK